MIITNCAVGRRSPWTAFLAISLFAFVASGCAVIGPRSISNGRVTYAESVNRTGDEQLLLSIVKGRYGESSTLLTVTGITANIKFTTSATSDEAGVIYEENPTISYSPVQGEKFIRQIMSPLPLELLLLTMRSTPELPWLLPLIVNRVNNIKNPDFLSSNPQNPAPEFEEFVELYIKLQSADVLNLVASSTEGVAFNIWLDNTTLEFADDIERLMDLLDLPMPETNKEMIVIPAYYALNINNAWGVGFTTRSTYDLMHQLKAAVLVPGSHIKDGIVKKYPQRGLLGEKLSIYSSLIKPLNASVVVRYRDHYFYIADNDEATKEVFRIVQLLYSVCIADTITMGPAPVLTIPVGN